jgi:osmoprotectant transport system permease protein
MTAFFTFMQGSGALIRMSLLRHLSWSASRAGGIVTPSRWAFSLASPRLAGPVLARRRHHPDHSGARHAGLRAAAMGIGMLPALAVLSLYAILCHSRITYTGITRRQKTYRGGAGLGMTNKHNLFQWNCRWPALHIAACANSTVYIVSWATQAALIGGGGLGDRIWTGLLDTTPTTSSRGPSVAVWRRPQRPHRAVQRANPASA